MNSLDEYLTPTLLCDFDRASEIKSTALQVANEASSRKEAVDRIFRYVKEFPYGLEDWDIRASETLHKGWGMCSSKTNLLVAMLRAMEIPARYKVTRTKTEGALWRWMAKQNGELTDQLGEPSPEQDHVVAQVYLDDWLEYDSSRDSALEEGFKRLNIPRNRELAMGPEGRPKTLLLASFDEWALARQKARRFRENRATLFAKMNQQFDRIRLLGKEASD